MKICRTSGGVDVYVDNTGGAPVSAAFQQCIDDTTVTGINLQPGTYLVDAPIVAWRAFRALLMLFWVTVPPMMLA